MSTSLQEILFFLEMFYGQWADLWLNCCNIRTEWLASTHTHTHTISGGHIPQCWMNVFSCYWSAPAVIGWHRVEWLLRPSERAVFHLLIYLFIFLPKRIEFKCNAYTICRAHWPNNPKCNPLHVLPCVRAANKSGFIFRRECTASVYTHAALDGEPTLNHLMTGLTHCDGHKFLLHKQKTRY